MPDIGLMRPNQIYSPGKNTTSLTRLKSILLEVRDFGWDSWSLESEFNTWVRYSQMPYLVYRNLAGEQSVRGIESYIIVWGPIYQFK